MLTLKENRFCKLFIFLSPAPESRSADFPFAQHPFRCFHSGSDVLIKHSFARLFCHPTWLPPDPSEPVLPILSPCHTLAGSSSWCWLWKKLTFASNYLSLPGSGEPICWLPLRLWASLRMKTPVESDALINVLLQDCLSQHLVLWGFIKLPLIPSGFSTGIPSILMLKNQLLTAFLHHLALTNLFQNFLLNPKPLRAYLSGFWRMIDSIFISSFIA